MAYTILDHPADVKFRTSGSTLDVVVAKKIGAPGNPEYAIGAVASDGSVWRNEAALQRRRNDRRPHVAGRSRRIPAN